jgi:hypothetical protein
MLRIYFLQQWFNLSRGYPVKMLKKVSIVALGVIPWAMGTVPSLHGGRAWEMVHRAFRRRSLRRRAVRLSRSASRRSAIPFVFTGTRWP